MFADAVAAPGPIDRGPLPEVAGWFRRQREPSAALPSLRCTRELHKARHRPSEFLDHRREKPSLVSPELLPLQGQVHEPESAIKKTR